MRTGPRPDGQAHEGEPCDPQARVHIPASQSAKEPCAVPLLVQHNTGWVPDHRCVYSDCFLRAPGRGSSGPSAAIAHKEAQPRPPPAQSARRATMSGGELKSEQAVVSKFQQLLEERNTLSTAAIERRSEVAEHDLVIKTLEPLDPARKCYRLIGDVMVERTVAEVLPAVTDNRNNLVSVSAAAGLFGGCQA